MVMKEEEEEERREGRRRRRRNALICCSSVVGGARDWLEGQGGCVWLGSWLLTVGRHRFDSDVPYYSLGSPSAICTVPLFCPYL